MTKNRSPLWPMAAALVLLVPGCFHFHYLTEGPPARFPAYEDLQHAVVFGLAVVSPLELGRICPSGFSRVDAVETFADGLAATLALDMYTPQTLTVTCTRGEATPSTPGP